MSERVETTYADLRPTDLVIDKAGNAWPIDDLQNGGNVEVFGVTFWLLEPTTKARLHYIIKTGQDIVTVSRIPSHADEAAKLEADFPKSSARDESSSAGQSVKPASDVDVATSASKPKPIGMINPDSFATMEEAIATVEEIGGTVEAAVTAVEVDAASAATEDAPLSIIPFADMTPLERRSHLYLLHGVIAYDMKSNGELAAMHDEAHRRHDDGSLKSAHIPHVHQVA